MRLFISFVLVASSGLAHAQEVGLAPDLRSLASAPLGLSSDDRFVAVGDEDAGELVLIDSEHLVEVTRLPVGARPVAVLPLASGELAVACADDDWVALVDPWLAAVTRIITTDREPRALASDGVHLFVAATVDATITSYDLGTSAIAWRASVGPNPTVLALDARHRSLTVGHLGPTRLERFAPSSGLALALEPSLARAEPTRALLPLSDGRVWALRETQLRPDLGKLPGTGSYGGSDRSPIELHAVLVEHAADSVPEEAEAYSKIDFAVARPWREKVPLAERSPLDLPATVARERETATRRYRSSKRVAEPWHMSSIAGGVALPDGEVLVVDTAGGRLWRGVDFPRRSFELGVAPTGIAVDRRGERVFVAYRHAGGVAAAALSRATEPFGRRTRGELDPRVWRSMTYGAPLDRIEAVGRRLFHTIDPRISSRSVACASCHPGGLSDGRTWTQSFGPRATPMLAGRLEGTAPYGWTGRSNTLEAHIRETIAHRIDGTGLAAPELDALVRYVRSLPAPRAPTRDPVLVARGHALFTRADVGCSSCHEGRYTTDGNRFEVGTTSADEMDRFRFARFVAPRDRAEPTPTAYDVPSLIGLARSAPYFHDGSAATLDEVIGVRNVHDTMGSTSHLSAEDRRALVAYLETL